LVGLTPGGYTLPEHQYAPGPSSTRLIEPQRGHPVLLLPPIAMTVHHLPDTYTRISSPAHLEKDADNVASHGAQRASPKDGPEGLVLPVDRLASSVRKCECKERSRDSKSS